MNEHMKPPLRRRSTSRVLNTGRQPTSAPPTAAELTREQLAAEEATERVGETPRTEVTPVDISRSPVQAPAAAHTSSAEASHDAAAGKEPTGATVRASQRTEAVPAPASLPTELALQPAPPPAGVESFPPAERQANRPRHDDVTNLADADSPPWTQGSGRPKDLPSAATVLNQRSIHRESLDASVASALRLKKRLKRFALDNELDHLPLGDIVTVALDEWLTVRGY